MIKIEYTINNKMSYGLSYQFKVSYLKYKNNIIYSPTFIMNNHKWKLSIYPKGNKQPNYISVYLACEDPPTKNIYFTIIYKKITKD